MALKRVHRCLKEAVSNNQGKPISFYKFAIDPFSLTYTIENLFNLASLTKDGVIKIERGPGYDLLLNILFYTELQKSILLFSVIFIFIRANLRLINNYGVVNF